MAAKIIQFPFRAPQDTKRHLGETGTQACMMEIAVQLANGDPSFARRITVRSDASLVELHRRIAYLYGWDASHNFYFSHGSCRYEDPELFATQDSLSARCRRIYSAANVPIAHVLSESDVPLFYVCNLANWWELRLSLIQNEALEQFG